MHTQAHAIINTALLQGNPTPARRSAAILGAVVPDLMIVFFFLYEKLVRRLDGWTIWSHDYYQPGIWQDIIDTFHSFPIALLLLGLARWRRNVWWTLFSLSLILHSALDLPFHQDDAHRHFFPFSDWRWRSPISYWDPRGFGTEVMMVEFFLVLVASSYLWSTGLSRLGKLGIAGAIALYALPFAFVFLHAR